MAEPQRKAAFIEPGDGAHLAWLGSRVRYLVVGEQTAGRYTVSAETVPPDGETVAQIRRREHAGYFVLSGELTAAVGNRTLALPAGGFLNVAPGTAHRFSNAAAEPAELLAVAGPAGFDEFRFRAGWPLSGAEEPVPAVTAEDRGTLATLAPSYGVDLDPPAAAFGAEPRLRVTLPGEGKRIAAAGDLYRFLAVSEDTDGRYALWHATLPPGGGPPLHSHANEDEGFFVLAGTVTFRADGGERRLGPGGFVQLPSGTRHRFANETAQPAAVLILVAPGGLERMFDETGRVWHGGDSLPGPPDSAELERLAAAAPGYGIELYL